MPALLRQQYTDPHHRHLHTREMMVDVELIRPDDNSQMSSVIQLVVFAHNPHGHNPHLPMFDAVATVPTEALGVILDGKRTLPPTGCNRTRLSKKTHKELLIHVEDASLLEVKTGDPIALISSLNDEGHTYFALVKAVEGDTLTLFDNGLPMPQFYKGAIVQNLANRWNPYRPTIGAKSQLKRPTIPTFTVRRDAKGVEFKVSMPISLGNLRFYDCYVRNHPIDYLDVHWVPDVMDVSPTTERLMVTTYNGGPEAGGGVIADDQPNALICTLIAKDKSGTHDVNESAINPSSVQRAL